MCEGRRPDVGGLRVQRHVHQLGHVVRDRCEPLHAVRGQRLDPHLQGEVRDDRGEVAVPGALAVPVDRALHLLGTAADTGERVGDPTAGVVVEVHADAHVGPDVVDDRAHRGFDVERQAPAVGVAEDEAVHALLGRALEHPQAELRVRPEPVEEVLGVEEDLEPEALQVGDRVRHHRHALVERGAERLRHVVVPALPDDADRAGPRLDEMAQGVVGVDLALGASGHPEGDERAGREVQLVARPAEQLVVLRVRARPARLDVVDAEPVELLGDAELVVDRQRDPFELRAVAQRRVVDLDLPRGRVTRRHAHTRSCTCRSGPGRPWRTPPRSPWSAGRGRGCCGRRRSSRR